MGGAMTDQMLSDNKCFTGVMDVVERIESATRPGTEIGCLWVKLRLPHRPVEEGSVEFAEDPSCKCFEMNVDHATGEVDAYMHLLTSKLQVRYLYDVEANAAVASDDLEPWGDDPEDDDDEPA